MKNGQEQPFPWKAALAVFLASLALKTAFLYSVRDHPFVAFPTNDEEQHLAAARDILENGLIREGAFYFAPLYPYMLAGFFSVFGEKVFLFKMLQAAAGAANAAVMFMLAWTVFKNRAAALAAALLTLLYGVYYLYEALLLKTAFAVLFTNLGLLLFVLAARKPAGILWAGCGLVFGWLALLRGNVLLLAPFLLAGILWEARRRGFKARAAGLWLAGFLAGLTPATLHNAIASHDFVLTTYQGGSNLYIGNNPRASGKYTALRPGRHLASKEKFDAVSLAEAAAGRALKPSEISNYWLQKSLKFMLGNPGRWLLLQCRKAVLFHASTEIEDTVHYGVFRSLAPALRLAFLPFGAILALAVPGIAWSLKNWREHLTLYLLLAGSAASVILFFIFSRYRLPAVSLYILFAAYGAAAFREGIRKRLWGDVGMWGAAALAVSLFSFFAVPPESPAASFNNLGVKYIEMGDAEKAIHYFKKAAANLPPCPSRANYQHNLAKALEKAGDPCAAAETMRFPVRYYQAETRNVSDPVRLRDYAGILKEQARFLRKCGRQADSRAALAEAREVYQRLAEDMAGGSFHRRDAFQQGVACAEAGKHQTALEYFREAQKENPGSAAIYVQSGLSHVALKQWEEARAAFQQAVRADPAHSYAWQLLGNVRHELGQRREALTAWRRSLELNPDNPPLRKNAGILQHQISSE